MNFLKKLFGEKPKEVEEKSPENTRLNFLLTNYSQNRSQGNYELVVKELLNGNSFLIVPTINDGIKNDWTKLDTDQTIKITSVFNLDGLKVLGVFSSEARLYHWAKTATQYTALQAQAVLDLCKEQDISRIVINSDSNDMFVLERNSNTKTLHIKKDEIVTVGTPAEPLSSHIIQNMVKGFKLIEEVLEAYQYLMERNGEVSIMIGIKLSAYSDNAKKAVLYKIQDALLDESSQMHVDILFLDTRDIYNNAKNIEGALFYKKGQ